MRIRPRDPTLLHEEKRAIKWFLAMFYLIYIFYEVFYNFIYKKYLLDTEPIMPGVFNYTIYMFIIMILPIAYLLNKRGKTFLIKYILVASYIIVSITSETMFFFNSSIEYQSGNAVEVLLILFSPIFVNTRFFWFVACSLFTKYLIVGLLLQSTEAALPVSLVMVLSIIGYILLKRFKGYVDAVKTSYNEQLDSIVKGVIATIELKDPYTRGHSERVAFYSKSLAMITGRFSEEELNSLHYACLLHDIGKVNIPDQILMKPSKLTPEEYETIKTHPSVGAEAIKRVDGLSTSIEVIYSHHERWDGKGYPDQLKEYEIPYLARVVAIADAFDAMTSSRSYREALSLEEAYTRILEGKGTQFDPELVSLFLRVFPDWAFFHQNYRWPTELPAEMNIYKKGVSI